MSFEVLTTPEFESQSKALQKRHRSFKNDLKALVLSLMENPFQRTELSPGIRKIRMAITSKGRGKSGGARIITYTIITAESEGRVYLMNAYDKSVFFLRGIVHYKEYDSGLKVTAIVIPSLVSFQFKPTEFQGFTNLSGLYCYN